MNYRLSDIPLLLVTPAGRMQLAEGVRYRLWPLLSRLAWAWRRTAARDTRVVAVVGSFGKSTTARAVAAVLAAPADERISQNAWSLLALAVLRIRPRQSHAVIEAGIAGRGQMERYAGVVRPDVTVVTSIGGEHQGSLGTLDVTRSEKAWMVKKLPATGTAVLNGDDANVMWMGEQTRARVVTFGFGASCDVRATDLALDWPSGSTFRVSAFGEQRDVRVRLIGRTMIYPALAAIAVAHVEGVRLDMALPALAALPPTRRRMEPFQLTNGVTLLCDDFKSPIETIDAALDALAEIPAGRRIVLFGGISHPPPKQRRSYARLGQRVAGIAAHLVVVGEALERYARGARRAGMPKAAIHDGGRTPQQAAAVLTGLLEPGDVVLIKGRDTQMLDRVRLILDGHPVGCEIAFCSLRRSDCESCPMVERGWGKHRVIMARSAWATDATDADPNAEAVEPKHSGSTNQASRRTGRRNAGFAYVGVSADPPSPCARHCAWRRAIRRR